MKTGLKSALPKQKQADIIVGPAIYNDAPKVWSIYLAGRLASQPNEEVGISRGDVWRYLCKGGDGSKDTVYDQKLKWEQRILAGNNRQQVLVAIDRSNGQRPVGIVWPHTEEDENWLSKLYVAKGMQGQGIGSKLIEATKAWHHYQPIKLRVAAYNKNALGLYVSHGFVPVSNVQSGYTIAGQTVPQVEMVYPGVTEANEATIC